MGIGMKINALCGGAIILIAEVGVVVSMALALNLFAYCDHNFQKVKESDRTIVFQCAKCTEVKVITMLVDKKKEHRAKEEGFAAMMARSSMYLEKAEKFSKQLDEILKNGKEK